MTEHDSRVEDTLLQLLPAELGARDWQDVLRRAGLITGPANANDPRPDGRPARQAARARRGVFKAGLLLASALVVIGSATAAALLLFPGHPAPQSVSDIISQFNQRGSPFTVAPPSRLLKPGGLPVPPKPTVGVPFGSLALPPGFPAPTPAHPRVSLTSAQRATLRAAVREYERIWGTNGLEVSKTRGVTTQRLHRGQLVLWGVPTTDGTLCTFLQFVDGANTGEPEAGACASPEMSQPPILYEERLFTSSNLRIVDGHVDAHVARMTVSGPGGRSTTVPLYDHFFLFDLPNDKQPRTLTALDASGYLLARVRIPGVTDPPSLNVSDTSTWALDRFLDANVLIALNTPVGVPLVLAARLYPDGEHAAISVASSALVVPTAGTIALNPSVPFLDISRDGIIAGHAPRGIATVEIVFTNGSRIVLRPFHGFILTLIPPKQALNAATPPTIITRNDSGRVSGRYKLVPAPCSPSEIVASTAPWQDQFASC